MPNWLEIAKGPAFRFALAILLLGLLRQVLLTLNGAFTAIRRAGNRHLAYREIVKETLKWIFPIHRLHRARPLQSVASFAFHGGLILAVAFLRNHIDLLQANVGIGWMALPRPLLDGATWFAIVGIIILLFYRLYSTPVRALSTMMDYILLILLLSVIGSGYLAGQVWNPIPYDVLMLLHTLTGIVLALLLPFTKIVHCVLFPLTRFCTEIAWHLIPDGGTQVIKTLYGPGGRRI